MNMGLPGSVIRFACRCGVVAALLLGSRPVDAQGRLAFRHLTTDDGLSGDVTALTQDRRGFLWIGTVDGLNRYDGYEVHEFRHSETDSTTLSDNGVSVVLEAHDGTLWVGTFGGLNRFDPATETFTRFVHNADDPSSLASDEVLSLAEDTDGVLWIGTSAGLNRLHPDTGTFDHFAADPTESNALNNNSIESLYVDAGGTLWIATQAGLHRFETETETFAFFPNPDPSPPANILSKIIGREAGGLWVGTFGSGLFAFDPDTATFLPTLLTEAVNSTVVVSSLLEGRNGALWVGTFGGLIRRDGTGQLVHFRASADDPTSLINDNVSAVFEDRQGILWIGTYGGLDRVDTARSAFTTTRHDPEDPTSLASNTVLSVLETSSGVLLVGTDRGLSLSEDGGQTFTHIGQSERGLGPDPDISALLEDRQGRLWVATQQGFYGFDLGARRFQRYGPLDLIVDDLYEDEQGTIWIGLLQGGLRRFDPATERLEPGLSTASLSSDQVKAVAQGADQQLWIGTRGGLNQLDLRGDSQAVTPYLSSPDDSASLSDNAILAVHADSEGILWIGTEGGGLNRFDPATPAQGFRSYTEANSDLPGNTIYAILEGTDGRLWISASRGLARFDPSTETFRVFSLGEDRRASGLTRAAFRTASGTLLLGSADAGLITFSPSQLIAANPHPPQIALTGVHVLNEPVRPDRGAALRVAAPVADAIYLGPDDYTVTFEFAALHFGDPPRNRYAVMLDGVDREWRVLDTDRRATYTTLPPGTYTLQVRAFSADGIESEEPLQVRVVVAPPWWRSIWAYLAYALLFIGALVGVDRLQRQRLMRQERTRVEQREAKLRAEMAEAEARVLKAENDRKAIELEKAHELESAYTALEESHRHLQTTQAQLIQAEKLASLGQLTAGIAHEIKNPLNFVNNFADLSVDLADELGEELEAHAEQPVQAVLPDLRDLLDDLKENARRIHEHGQRADRIVHAMLQHSHGGSGERAPTDLNALVEEYVNLSYHGQRAKNSDFTATIQTELDPAVGLVHLVPQEIGRVLINLLGNAFYAVQEYAKLQDPDYQPTVTVSTHRRAMGTEVRVADNGPGIPADVQAHIFEPFFTTKPTGSGTGLGLSLSYEIVTQGHSGALRVESSVGEGAVFVMTLPSMAS